MILEDIFRWCYALVPESNGVIPSISTTQLCVKDIANEGCREFVRITRCLPKDKKFNCTAGISSYAISGNISDFSEMREEGMWHLRSDASTTSWERLKPTTVRDLDQSFSNWRTQSVNDNVNKYWQDGDMLNVFYTPSTTLTNGFWAYYYALSNDMTATTHYPFTGSTTQDPRLSPYEKYILAYYEHKALGILGYKDDSANKLTEFITMCQKAKMELASRRDLAQESRAKPKTALRLGNPFRR